ncbi:MAG: hypothetical protein U0744_02520 [Gemmataceae bacterium]
MTDGELWDRHGAELVGLLLDAFSQADRSQVDAEAKGRYMLQKMRQARNYLQKIHAAFQPENKPLRQPNGKEPVRN